MAYHKRTTRRKSKTGFGSTVSDVIRIANRFGPKGTLIAGFFAFLFFYYLLPLLLMSFTSESGVRMSGQHAALIDKFFNDILIRRLINPSKWAGVAMFTACVLLASWKAFTRTDLNRRDERELSWLSKVLARFID